MTSTDQIDQIDALVVARRILANPKTFRVSTHEMLAMAGCLIGLDQQLDEIEAAPLLQASLAAAIARFIETENTFVEEVRSEVFASDDIWHQRERDFYALKTIFEEEFPHVGNR